MEYLADFSKPYGIWTSNRSTPIVVGSNSASDARKQANKKMKKGYGSITNVRELKGVSAKLAKKGKWVRERKSGLSPQFGKKEDKLKARKDITKYRKGLAKKSRESLEK